MRLVLAGLLLALSAPARAQAPEPPEAALALRISPLEGPAAALTTPAGAFGASLVLPGAGQAALGLRRSVAYGALEAAFWTLRLHALSGERRASRGYRDLAWEAARAQASTPRVDGSWGYYETMSQYVRSGAFDRDPGQPGVQPEEDPASYNGTVWRLARGLYLPGGTGGPETPEYGLALEYYVERAAGPAFLWSWEGEPGALERFRALIGDADEASRNASAALGAVLANHLVSAVDALIVARIRSETGIRLESRAMPAHPLRWSVGVRVPIPD